MSTEIPFLPVCFCHLVTLCQHSQFISRFLTRYRYLLLFVYCELLADVYLQCCVLQCTRSYSAHWKMRWVQTSNGIMHDTWGLQRNESFYLQNSILWRYLFIKFCWKLNMRECVTAESHCAERLWHNLIIVYLALLSFAPGIWVSA